MTLQRISMEKLKDPKYQEEKLILQWMSEHLHFSLASQDVFVDFKEKYVKVRHQLYYYHILHEGSQAHIWVTMKRGNFDVAFSEVPENRKKAILKSRKGKVRATKATFLLLSAVSISLVATSLKSTYTVEAPVVVETNSELEEDVDNVILPSYEEDVMVTVSTPEEFSESFDSTIILAEQVISNENRVAKRSQTDELYGDIILKYSERYGQPYALVASLLTQERSDNPNDSLEVQKNIGQLTTTSICGEKIIAPVFSHGELQGYDKIYVLPPCYDDYPIDDLDTMGHFPKFSEEEQQMIQAAIQLKSEGYQIYRRCDAFYTTENNIKISVAYLSYIVNMKHDLVRGYMSYNGGYAKISDSLSLEVLLSGNVEMDDPYYFGHILQYVTDEELHEVMPIYYADGSVVNYEIELQNEVLREETGHHL